MSQDYINDLDIYDSIIFVNHLNANRNAISFFFGSAANPPAGLYIKMT